MKDRMVKQFLLRGGYQWEEREHKERIKKGKCEGRILCLCMKVEQ
jgi:hypothetical protein